uniref:VPS37C subunit of ESCRT-I n=1 Tax=Lepisosteus oculatus TaxID=7918 RepID=W5MNJ3_LEPOC|nr:PREDICTED: vacuolar protein sorting-associated protein 37C [Lepisosteus oculatus]XP_015209415.1 PREDICTED: vacuolar protein sorting-associated protein 37C [Lepisosteus oculatus]XP_015209416.1 PREDICTED: vacuolar protein sorting-associated protein 37C [Lepisosteus oculatus]XP_015209417.1 PREDICTED: vacuolar protein sorting-associated protein 37C [Lepisosteus oculatus]XP_015209418.1 PREDICTED: vacuolar protein sorting-associated protein 37C [Lepisosteus oculatus]
MEKLRELSHAELQALLDNQEKLESLVLESDEVQSIQLEREMCLASNRSLAERNLELRPRLEEGRERLGERYRELRELHDRYRGCCQERDNKLSQFSPELVFLKLEAEGATVETESEALADQFLEGQLALDSFLDQFHSKRCLAHSRRVRIEKLQDILRQKREGGGGATRPAEMTSQSRACDPFSWKPQESPQLQQKQEDFQPATEVSFPSSQPGPPPPAPSSGPFPSPALPYPSSPQKSQAQGPTAQGPLPAVPFPAQACQGPPSVGPGFNTRPGFPPHPGPGPGFGPSACPYPVQQGFPVPPPQFGQFNPSYPCPYPSPGYSYPPNPNVAPHQSPTARPGCYRPSYGMPQPYS